MATDTPSTEPEEGDACLCGGHMAFAPDGPCSCHLKAPCGACENAKLVCSSCGGDGYA